MSKVLTSISVKPFDLERFNFSENFRTWHFSTLAYFFISEAITPARCKDGGASLSTIICCNLVLSEAYEE